MRPREGPSRPQLVLDAGGVLIHDLRPRFWETVARETSAPSLETAFRQGPREEFWTGKVSVGTFYDWLVAQTGKPDRAWFEREVRRCLTPLPGLARLAGWGQRADLHLLSNHRSEWLDEALGASLAHFSSITVSDREGAIKPSLQLFTAVQRRLSPGPVAYCDDRVENLAVGRNLGWHAILADADDWQGRLDAWLTWASR